MEGDAPDQESGEKTNNKKVQIIQYSLVLYSGDVPFCV